MAYAKWEEKETFLQDLTCFKKDGKLEVSGLPQVYMNDKVYLDVKDTHNLIIGSTGSGKTQTMLLPITRFSIDALESFLIIDTNCDIYKRVSGNLKKNNYNVIIMDFDEKKYGNNWNPLYMTYQYYLDGNIDKTIKSLEDICYYLFGEHKDFWINSAENYFIGLALYLFKYAKLEEINLKSIYKLGNSNINSDLLNDSLFLGLNNILKTPVETLNGIIAVFNECLQKYINKVNLMNMLSNTDFDFNEISQKRTAIFIKGIENSDETNIITLFIHQIINQLFINNSKRFNFILDDFENLVKIKRFSKLLNEARSKNIRFTISLNSLKELEIIYGKEDSDILKTCFATIIYLLANDYLTLEEISKLCGNKSRSERLINVEELKVLQFFEAIIIKLRHMPFKTKLVPDYKLNWHEELEEVLLKKRNNVDVKTFELE